MIVPMIEFSTFYVVGFKPSLIAMRLPYKSTNDTIFGYNEDILTFGEKDLKLAQTLIRKGGPHAKFSRGILAYVDINAPVFFWQEAETYRCGHERLCSESTMNMEGRGLSGEELSKVKAEIPMGRMLRKIDFFSYQCLRAIYIYRKDHRLPEWHKFIDWIRTLPYAEELIFC